MSRFSVFVFATSLTVLLAIWAIISPVYFMPETWSREKLALANVGIVVVIILLSVGLGYWRLPPKAIRHIQRYLFKSIARSVISASLDEYARPLYPRGIINRNGTVGLRIDVESQRAVITGDRLNLYNEDSGDIWGVIEVAEIYGDVAIGIPEDRINPDFWERLEDRMRHDTSPPPRVYLVNE